MIVVEPITDDELREARAILARGGSLREAAVWLGCTAANLDLALWNAMGGEVQPR